VNRERTSSAAAFILIVGTSALAPMQPFVGESPCRAGSDTATLAVNVVKNALAASDSVESLQPGDVTASIVMDSVICQIIVDNYNAARVGPDSILRVNSGFIVRAVIPTADTAYAMYLPTTAGPPSRTEELVHFDKTFHLLLIQSALN
jgi:hypothetical protein